MPRVVASPSDAVFVVDDGCIINKNGSKLPVSGRVVDAAGLESGAAVFLLHLKSGVTRLKTCHTDGHGVDLGTVSSIDFDERYDRISLSEDGIFGLTGESHSLQLGTVEPDGTELNVLFCEPNVACCTFVSTTLFTVDDDGEIISRWDAVTDDAPSATRTLADFGISSVAAIKGTATEVVLVTYEGEVFSFDPHSLTPCRLGVLPMPEAMSVDLIVSDVGVAIAASRALLLRDGSVLETAKPFVGLCDQSFVIFDSVPSMTRESFAIPLIGAFLESDEKNDDIDQMETSLQFTEPADGPTFRFFVSPLIQNRTRWLPVHVETACQPPLLHLTSSQAQAVVVVADAQTQKVDEEALADKKELEDIRAEVSALHTISESTAIDRVVSYASRCSNVASAETNRSTVDEMVRNSKLA